MNTSTQWYNDFLANYRQDPDPDNRRRIAEQLADAAARLNGRGLKGCRTTARSWLPPPEEAT